MTLILFAIQPAHSQTISLEEYLVKAQATNLDLKFSQTKSDAANAKSIGLSIPPPMVGFTQYKEKEGMSASGFEVSQMIPFPTKLAKDHAARKFESEAQDENQHVTEKVILAKAKLLYFSLWYNQERISILQEKKTVLQDHIKLSRSTVRSDSFAAIHLLKAESELDLLENEIESAKQMLREKQIESVVFINADPESVKPIAVEPKLSTIPKLQSSETSHQVKELKLNLESLKARELEAKFSWLPDFTLRYKEMGATSTTNQSKEIMVGVTLPFIFFWEPYSNSSQASAAKFLAEYTLQKQQRMISSDQSILKERSVSLKKQIENLNNKLLPRAEKRMRQVHNLAPRDMETLQDHRETMEALPELKMKTLDLRMDYEKTISALEQYASDKDSNNE